MIHNNTETSIAAAEAIRPFSGRGRLAVYQSLENRPQTREELTESTGLNGDTVRPRVAELLQRGMVRENGERATQSGRMAKVLEVVRNRIKEMTRMDCDEMLAYRQPESE
jgi:predicted transcriptional regulator